MPIGPRNILRRSASFTRVQRAVRVRNLVTILLSLGIGACTHECPSERAVPQNAAQELALKDAQTKSARFCNSERARCGYRILQDSDGPIRVKVYHDYINPEGKCGGDTFDEWKYNSNGIAVK
jgi:hypothetical protein